MDPVLADNITVTDENYDNHKVLDNHLCYLPHCLRINSPLQNKEQFYCSQIPWFCAAPDRTLTWSWPYKFFSKTQNNINIWRLCFIIDILAIGCRCSVCLQDMWTRSSKVMPLIYNCNDWYFVTWATVSLRFFTVKNFCKSPVNSYVPSYISILKNNLRKHDTNFFWRKVLSSGFMQQQKKQGMYTTAHISQKLLVFSWVSDFSVWKNGPLGAVKMQRRI